MDTNGDIQKLRELIHGIDCAMLTTVDPAGRLISRPMAAQHSEFDGDLWFFTRDDSPKADHVLHNREVNVTFTNSKSGTYVSVAGKAAVFRDRAKAEELWSPAYKVWFPGGLDDPHLALLKVTVQMAEYWRGPSNPVTRLFGFAKGLLTDDKQLGGEHRKMAIGH